MSSLFSNRRSLPRRSKMLLFAAAAAAMFFLLRQTLLHLFFQIGLAALLAWAARPVCVRFERRFPPGIAAALSLLCFAAVLLVFFILFIPQLVSQISLAAGAVPQLIIILQSFLDRLTRSSLLSTVSPFVLPSGEVMQKVSQELLSILPRALQLIGRAVSRLTRAFLSPVLAFYFLRDRESFCFQLSLFIPLRYRKNALSTLREIRRDVAGYFRGQLLVSSATGALTAAALLILGIPSWLPLGILMGLCDFIPYVGPWLGAVPIVLFSLPMGIGTALWTVAAVALVQQVESIFLSPYFMSGATGLHPAYVLLLLSFGGLYKGLTGMLLALPVFICLRGILRAVSFAANTEKEPP